MKPFIVPVFLPHSGCPHQCAFCNQKAISGHGSGRISLKAVREQIERFLSFEHEQRQTMQISFYGGNFLGLAEESIHTLLDEACRFIKQGQVDSIRFSTRPDTISSATLELIRDYPVQTVEIGAQSMDDRVLAKSRRGHTAQDTENAVKLLKVTPYEIGLQMMIGLPGDNDASTLVTARRIADFSPDFVRIYPALVLKGSPMAAWYTSGEFIPLSLDEAVERVKSLYLFFQERAIPVIRMGLQASDTLNSDKTVLAGPYHPAFGHLVLSSIFLDRAVELLKKRDPSSNRVVLKVRPENISRMRGQNNQNVKMLKRQFQLETIDVMPDAEMSGDDIRLGAIRADS